MPPTAEEPAPSPYVDVTLPDCAAEPLSIAVPLPGGVRQFARPQGETLAKTLARVRSAAALPARHKRAKTEAPAPLPALYVALLDAAGVALREDATLNATAWKPGHVLALGEARLPLRVNAPSVGSLYLPAVALAGFPMAPLPLELRYCSAEQLDWTWIRGDGAVVCTERFYTPRLEDVGLELRCSAAPPAPAGGLPGGRAAHASAGRVRAAPPRPEAAARRAWAARAPGCVRVATFNVLADAYSHLFARIYPYCPPEAAAAAYRTQLCLSDVESSDCDVICLQEVDAKLFARFWAPQLSERLGYAASFLPKSSTSGEGVALFVRPSSYAVAALLAVDLRLGPPPLPPPPPPVAALLAEQPRLADAMARVNTVAQLAHLVPVDASLPPLLIANTHLFFAARATSVRLLQASSLLARAAAFAAELGAAAPPHLVLAGDLNAEPHDGALTFLTGGRIDAAAADWATGRAFTFDRAAVAAEAEADAEAGAGAGAGGALAAAPAEAAQACGISLTHEFGPLRNGCDAPGLEWTNYVVGFRAVIDYVLHSDGLRAVSAMPPATAFGPLPNAAQGSDHVIQVCDLMLR